MADEKQDRLLTWGEVRDWLDNYFNRPISPSTVDVLIESGRIRADEEKRVWESQLQRAFPKSRRSQIIRELFGSSKGLKGPKKSGDREHFKKRKLKS